MGSVSAREIKTPNHGNYVQSSVIANNVELSLNIEDFFNSLWKDKDSIFYKDFLTSLKCFDTKVEPWWLQESTFTIHRNVFTKHKNNSKSNINVQTVDTIKEQTITYNPQDRELTINETISYLHAPYSDKFKLFITWKVTETKIEIIKNVPSKRSAILITARIEFNESLKGKKLRAKIAYELFEELQIEYYLYYQLAQKFTSNKLTAKEDLIFQQIESKVANNHSPVKQRSSSNSPMPFDISGWFSFICTFVKL